MRGTRSASGPPAEDAVDKILFGAKLTDTGDAAVERLLGAALEDVTCGLGFKVDPTEVRNTKAIDNAFQRLTAAEDRRRSQDGLGLEPMVFKGRRRGLEASFTARKQDGHNREPEDGLDPVAHRQHPPGAGQQHERPKQRKEGLREIKSLEKERVGFVNALIASKPRKRR